MNLIRNVNARFAADVVHCSPAPRGPREADVFTGHHVNRILDARANVFLLQIGVVIPNDLGKGDALADQLQDAVHGNPCPSHAGLPKMAFNRCFRAEGLPTLSGKKKKSLTQLICCQGLR
jgi:hypothetical protein